MIDDQLLPESDVPAYRDELAVAVRAARAGAAQIMPIYEASDGLGVQVKSDGSPVTAADLASDMAIRAVIGERFPDDAILTEEGVDETSRLTSSRVWIADPLDGTRQFVDHTGDFDVFVALVIGGAPVVVTSCHPPSGDLLYAVRGHGAWRQTSDGTVTRVELGDAKTPARVVTSVYFGAPEIVPRLEQALSTVATTPVEVIGPGFHPRHFAPAGGGPPEMDVFIAGIADAYLAGGEWDAVVSDLFVREAGGAFSDLWGEPYLYNKPDARNIYGFVASTDPQLHLEVLAGLRAMRPATKPAVG